MFPVSFLSGILFTLSGQALYREMAQTLNDECFLVWLPTLRMKLPVSARFGNVHPSPMPHRILWNSDRIFQHASGTR